MAMANIRDIFSSSVTTHIGRKEDEICAIVLKIEDIGDKIRTAKNGDFLKSGALECGDIKFRLFIYPNGDTPNRTGKLSVGIEIRNQGRRNWKNMEIFAAENSQGEFLKRLPRSRAALMQLSESMAYGFTDKLFSHDLILADENSSYFPDGVLKVKAIINVQGEETVTHKKTKPPSITCSDITPPQLREELASHLRRMMESRKFTDFQIVCQGEVIPCHRSLLSARSEIFEAMLEHDMKESETGKVEINDFDIETVKAIILYMYTGEVNRYTEDVMRAADKYGLEGLKKVIEDSLIKDIKIENSICMFVLGDAVHADNLRDAAKAIIVNNAATIVEMDGWREVLGRFQDLTFEIFESVAKKGT